MHDAGLQRRFGIDHGERLAHALQAVGDRDQDVVAAACLQVVKDLHPELGAFGAFDPQTENVPRAVGQHAQGQIDRLAANHGIFPDLHPQRIEKDHRIHQFERPSLPGRNLRHDRVGDAADKVRRDLDLVLIQEEALDLAHGHAPRVHGDDVVVKSGEAPLVLGDEQRLEAAIPVPRHLDAHIDPIEQRT